MEETFPHDKRGTTSFIVIAIQSLFAQGGIDSPNQIIVVQIQEVLPGCCLNRMLECCWQVHSLVDLIEVGVGLILAGVAARSAGRERRAVLVSHLSCLLLLSLR